jgi:cobalt/nickel transport system permease protein
MKQAFLFFFFFLILSLKKIEYLLIAFAIVELVAFKDAWKLSKRVVKSIFFFNLSVSIGYILLGIFKHISPWHYVIYINLKVFTLTLFVFWFFSKVSIIEFFSFSREMSYLLTITLSQIYSYKKTFEDFRAAFRARVVNLRDKEMVFVKSVFDFFLKKAMHDSHERGLAMRARGFFDE